VSQNVSKNVRTPLMVARNAVLAGLVAVGGTGLAAVAVAPAALASAADFYNASLSVSPSDPGLVTATFTNKLNEIAPGAIDLTNPARSISVPVAAATTSVPTQTTTYTFRLLPGQTAQARIGTTVLGQPYTNPGVPAPLPITADAPTQVGNVVTVPVAKAGVQYFIQGGVNKPLSAQQITLRAGQALTIVARPTVPPVAPLTGTTSWTFSYVAPAPAQVTPEAPKLISGNLYRIPTGSGYHYEIAGKVVVGTAYATEEGTTVEAVSDSASLELVGQTSWLLDYAAPPVPDEGKNRKIMICHATGSATNPYEAITISINGLEGHEHHDGDIWPASDGVTAHNWTDATAKIYAANCKVQAPTPPPSNGGDNGDHGGDKGGNTGGTTTTPPSGGSTGGTTGGGTAGTGSTTSTTPVIPSTTSQTQATVTGNQPAGPGLLVKAETGVNPSTDPTSINVIGGLSVVAAIGAFALFRRPKHRAE
jgi:hypothetical protein